MYLREGVQETKDLSFTTPSWAGAAGRLQLPSGQPEARHPTEAESMPPGFTRTQCKMPEEQEVVAKYRTPGKPVKNSPLMRSWASRMSPPSMSLGTPQWRQRWHRPLRASLISFSPWTWTLHQPNIRCPRMMNWNYWEWPRDRTSPVTAREDIVLDTPAGFSRAPGDSRLTPESSTGATGRRITGCTE